MSDARDAAIVAGLRRRLVAADAVTLTNFAWFAARRGAAAAAIEAAGRALLLRDAPTAARRALERLSAGRFDGLLLVAPDEHQPPSPPRVATAVAAPAPATDPLWEGRQLLANGRLAEALQRFEQVLLARPSDSTALFHRGVVLAKLRRYREALRDWESVGLADPEGRLGAVSRRHARAARELASLFTSQ